MHENQSAEGKIYARVNTGFRLTWQGKGDWPGIKA